MYLERRGIRPDLSESFQLGAAPDAWRGLLEAARTQGFPEDLLVEAGLVIRQPDSGNTYDRFRARLIFPILDHLARCIGFGGRIVVDDPDKQQAKYINSSETPLYHKGKSLYGLYQAHRAIEKKGRALLVEGYLDCIMAHQGGFPETVATLGTALTPDQARLLRRFCRQIVFVYDGDEAGQQAMKRGAEVLVRAGLQVHAAVLPPEDDPDSLIRREGQEGFTRFIDNAVDIFDYFLRLALPQDGKAEIIHRIAAIDSIAPLLLSLEDPVEKNLRMKAVAQTIGVDLPAVEAFLARRDKRSAKRPGSPATSSPPLSSGGSTLPSLSVPLLELGILRGVVEDDRFMTWLQSAIEPIWLDPTIAELVRRIMELKGTSEFDSMEFYQSLDPAMRNLYAAALFDDDLISPKDNRECEEARIRLEVRYLKQCAARWLETTHAMLSQNPDHAWSPEALQEFHRLNREAQECVRRLERTSIVVQSAVRIQSL